jgi:hypothetical protein
MYLHTYVHTYILHRCWSIQCIGDKVKVSFDLLSLAMGSKFPFSAKLEPILRLLNLHTPTTPAL